jgi:hypothetical protein
VCPEHCSEGRPVGVDLSEDDLRRRCCPTSRQHSHADNIRYVHLLSTTALGHYASSRHKGKAVHVRSGVRVC